MPSVKSASLAAFAPVPVNTQSTVVAPPVAPDRVTVKVKGVGPALPSSRLALVAAMAREASSLMIVPVAEDVTIDPPVALESRATKSSSASTARSPATLMVTSLVVSPTANVRLPVGRTLPAKSSAVAVLGRPPMTAQSTEVTPAVGPLLVTVNVNGVESALPSALLALVAAMAREATAAVSSLIIVPDAVAVVIDAPVALDRLMVNASSASYSLSPATLTVMVLVVSPAAKVRVPFGSVPPAKSSAVAGFGSPPPADQLTVVTAEVNPVLVAVNVNGVVPELPSALLALVAATAIAVSSLTIVPVAEAVPSDPPVTFDRTTENDSSDSTARSPAMSTVTVFDVSPMANVKLPDGRAPPRKSSVVTGFELPGETAQLAVVAAVVGPVLVTVNVNGVVPELPSALLALVAAIDSVADVGGGFTVRENAYCPRLP